jgi:tRNA-dihydrouridine synthase B
VAGIGFHPRHASQGDAGRPDYALARELAESLPVPVVLSGGLSSEQRTLHAFAESGAAAVMLARGSLGNPWRFARLHGARDCDPSPQEVAAELEWVIERAEERQGRPLPAQVLRLVRRHASAPEAGARAAPDRADDDARAESAPVARAARGRRWRFHG